MKKIFKSKSARIAVAMLMVIAMAAAFVPMALAENEPEHICENPVSAGFTYCGYETEAECPLYGTFEQVACDDKDCKYTEKVEKEADREHILNCTGNDGNSHWNRGWDKKPDEYYPDLVRHNSGAVIHYDNSGNGYDDCGDYDCEGAGDNGEHQKHVLYYSVKEHVAHTVDGDEHGCEKVEIFECGCETEIEIEYFTVTIMYHYRTGTTGAFTYAAGMDVVTTDHEDETDYDANQAVNAPATKVFNGTTYSYNSIGGDTFTGTIAGRDIVINVYYEYVSTYTYFPPIENENPPVINENPPVIEEEPEVVIDEEPAILAEAEPEPEPEPEEEIELVEEVPLAEAPATGDLATMTISAILALVALTGIALVIFTAKKREN